MYNDGKNSADTRDGGIGCDAASGAPIQEAKVYGVFGHRRRHVMAVDWRGSQRRFDPQTARLVDELLATVPSGEPGIVLWDVRKHADAAATLSDFALHSTRFALIVLDNAVNAGVWTLPLQQRQIVANVGLPLSSVVLGKALESAREEVNARIALLGESSGASGASAAPTVPQTRLAGCPSPSEPRSWPRPPRRSC